MYLSIRHNMVTDPAFTTPADGMRRLGVEFFEVELTRDYKVCAMDSREMIALESDDDARKYKQHIEAFGIRGCCFLTACDFSVGDPEDNIQWVTRAVQLADAMDMPSVRIDSAMKREKELDFEMRVDLFATNLAAVIERTNGSNVSLGIENHGFQGNNLGFQLNVYQQVGSDRLGSTLDTGNFYWRGYPLSEVYGILRILAPYAKHTHLKNIKYPEDKRETVREAGWEYETYVSPLDEGDIDHAKVLAMLKDAGYDGDVCIEDESLHHYSDPEERVAVLERDVGHVKGIIERLEG